MKFRVPRRLLCFCLLAFNLASCGGSGSSLPGTSRLRTAFLRSSADQAVSITYAQAPAEHAAATSLSNTVTQSQPTAGNLLVANVTNYDYRGGGSIIDPTGWTLLDSATTSTTLKNKVYYRWVQPGDNGVWTFNFGSASYSSVLIMELANVDALAPIAAHQVKTAPSTNTFSTASLASTSSNSFAVALFSTNGSPSIASEQPGWTDDYHRTGSMQNVLMHMTGTGTMQSSLTWSANSSGFATLIVLSPSAIAPLTSPPPNSTPAPSPSGAGSITYAHTIAEHLAGNALSNTATQSQPTVGNLLVANVTDYDYRGGGSIADPTGWTLLDSATNGSTLRNKVYYRWAQPGDNGVWTFNFGTTSYSSVLIMELANVDAAAPIAAHQVKAIGSTNTFTTAALSSAVANSFAVALFSTNGSPSIAAEQPGWTDDYHRTGSMQAALLHRVVTGATQSSLTWSASSSGFATLVVLSPSATAPLPTPAPTPSPVPLSSGPYHIATWAYDGGYQANNIAGADIARLVTYAEGSNKALQDCAGGACTSVRYIDATYVYTSNTCPAGGTYAAASEDWFVHLSGYSDAAHRLTNSNRVACGVPQSVYAWNLDSAGYQASFLSNLQSVGDGYGAYYKDDSKQTVRQFYADGGLCTTSPNSMCSPGTVQEFATDQSVFDSQVNFIATLKHRNGDPMKVIVNSTGSEAFIGASPQVIGSNMEGAVISYDGLRPQFYAGTLDKMASVNKTTGFLTLNSNGGGNLDGSAAQITLRNLHTGIMWLGYREGHTVSWENLPHSNANLAVWPEEMIYPSNPIQSMTNGAIDLQVASGVWRREFSTCYLRGSYFGPCAAVVNSTSAPVVVQNAWLSNTYLHVMTITGGDELSGGAVSINSQPFTAGTTTVAAGNGLLLAQ